MKLSQFRGKDRKKILLVYLILIIVIVVVAVTAFAVIRPKVQAGRSARQAAAAEQNQAAADEVDVLISQIGDVTADSGSAIDAARSAYDALTGKQKDLVTLLDVLTNAEDTYAQLTEAAEAAAQDAAAQESAESVEEGTEQAEAAETAEAGQDYILPDSDSRYLDRSELADLTQEELRIARNEIYARHGRRFDDETLQSYFDSKSWYSGTIDPADFEESMLNDYEKQNAWLISDYESEMGYR